MAVAVPKVRKPRAPHPVTAPEAAARAQNTAMLRAAWGVARAEGAKKLTPAHFEAGRVSIGLPAKGTSTH